MHSFTSEGCFAFCGESKELSKYKVYFGQDLVCNNLFGIGQISIYLRSNSSNQVEIFVTGTMSHENCYTIFQAKRMFL